MLTDVPLMTNSVVMTDHSEGTVLHRFWLFLSLYWCGPTHHSPPLAIFVHLPASNIMASPCKSQRAASAEFNQRHLISMTVALFT